MSILHIPDIAHTGTAIEIAFIGHLYVHSLERVDGWAQIHAMTILLNPDFIPGSDPQFFYEVRRKKNFIVFVDVSVVDLCHSGRYSCLEMSSHTNSFYGLIVSASI